jgi:hypothetical protein
MSHYLSSLRTHFTPFSDGKSQTFAQKPQLQQLSKSLLNA